MRHQFHAEQWVPYAPEQVFAFFADPANLPPLMPAWQAARIERATYVPPPGAPAGKVVAGVGSVITISFRAVPLLPLRMEWDAVIREFQWNEHFCDEQVRGPFKHFYHCHRIRPETRRGVAGTLVSDAVEYELPFGRLGDAGNVVVMKGQLRGLFSHRQKMLVQLLEG